MKDTNRQGSQTSVTELLNNGPTTEPLTPATESQLEAETAATGTEFTLNELQKETLDWAQDAYCIVKPNISPLTASAKLILSDLKSKLEVQDRNGHGQGLYDVVQESKEWSDDGKQGQSAKAKDSCVLTRVTVKGAQFSVPATLLQRTLVELSACEKVEPGEYSGGAFCGGTPKPTPYNQSVPALDFEPNRMLGERYLKPTQLNHVLAVGETGSGKTLSALWPMTRAVLGFKSDGLTSAAFVVDPKKELLDPLRSRMHTLNRSEDVMVLGHPDANGNTIPFRYFTEEDRHLSPSDRYDKVSQMASPGLANEGGDSRRWQQHGDEFNKDNLAWDYSVLQATGRGGIELILAVLMPERAPPRNQWESLKMLYEVIGTQSQMKAAAVVAEMLMRLTGVSRENPFERFAGSPAMLEQSFYRITNGRRVVDVAADPVVSAIIDLDIYPKNEAASSKQRLDWVDLLDSGKVAVYQPENTKTHEFVVRALKSGFFRASMGRNQTLRPVFYIADEFQRFITLWGDSADKDFLDRCRAYRVICMMATQSYAALLSAFGGQKTADLNCLMNNFTTLMVFRGNDQQMTQRLKHSIPQKRLNPHILDVRPIALLNTGEYYFTSGGQWGRHQQAVSSEALV